MVSVRLSAARADQGAMRECFRCKVTKDHAGAADGDDVWHTSSRNFFAKRFRPGPPWGG